MQLDRIHRKENETASEKVADYLGRKHIHRIYEHADVFHCEPIEKVAEELIEECNIPKGSFDNVGACRYTVPDYWDIGEVYERLIEDSYSDQDIEKGLWQVYHSRIDSSISDYNTGFYYRIERLSGSLLSGWFDIIDENGVINGHGCKSQSMGTICALLKTRDESGTVFL